MRCVLLLLYCALSAMGFSCGRRANPAPHEQAPAANARPTEVTRTKPTHEFAQPEYELSMTPTAEREGNTVGVLLAVKARAPYHINREYPIHIALEAPSGVVVEPAVLEAKDARMSDATATFETRATLGPGVHVLKARVDFAVCTAERCLTDVRTLMLELRGIPENERAAPKAAAHETQVNHGK